MKKFAITLGVFYILLAFGSVYPNDIVGSNAWIATDFLHNLIHFLVGSILVGVALVSPIFLPRILSAAGFLFLILAVLGSWFTGFDIGRVMGIMSANGIGHMIHLVTGVMCIVFGTINHRLD